MESLGTEGLWQIQHSPILIYFTEEYKLSCELSMDSLLVGVEGRREVDNEVKKG